MSGNVRQRMIEGAAEVLARKGLQATAFSEVLALTGASRGSIYHHFPGGKAELIEAVLEHFAGHIDDQLRALHGGSAVQVVRGALALWRARLVRNDCEAGCPVAAVTVAADSSRLEGDCRHAFTQWQATLASALKAGGLPLTQAQSLATLTLAVVQGGVLLSRAHNSLEPYDMAANQLEQHVAQITA